VIGTDLMPGSATPLLLCGAYVALKAAMAAVARPAAAPDFVQAYKAYILLIPVCALAGRRLFSLRWLGLLARVLIVLFLARYAEAYAALSQEKPEAVELFASLHRDFPADSATAFHVRRLAAGESGVLVVMQEK